VLGLVIGFTDHVQDVTTEKYNTLAEIHTTDHFILNILSLFSLVFAAVLNNGYPSAVFALSVSCQQILTQEL
jgi:hypothetical protein